MALLLIPEGGLHSSIHFLYHQDNQPSQKSSFTQMVHWHHRQTFHFTANSHTHLQVYPVRNRAIIRHQNESTERALHQTITK